MLLPIEPHIHVPTEPHSAPRTAAGLSLGVDDDGALAAGEADQVAVGTLVGVEEVATVALAAGHVQIDAQASQPLLRLHLDQSGNPVLQRLPDDGGKPSFTNGAADVRVREFLQAAEAEEAVFMTRRNDGVGGRQCSSAEFTALEAGLVAGQGLRSQGLGRLVGVGDWVAAGGAVLFVGVLSADSGGNSRQVKRPFDLREIRLPPCRSRIRRSDFLSSEC